MGARLQQIIDEMEKTRIALRGQLNKAILKRGLALVSLKSCKMRIAEAADHNDGCNQFLIPVCMFAPPRPVHRTDAAAVLRPLSNTLWLRDVTMRISPSIGVVIGFRKGIAVRA